MKVWNTGTTEIAVYGVTIPPRSSADLPEEEVRRQPGPLTALRNRGELSTENPMKKIKNNTDKGLLLKNLEGPVETHINIMLLPGEELKIPDEMFSAVEDRVNEHMKMADGYTLAVESVEEEPKKEEPKEEKPEVDSTVDPVLSDNGEEKKESPKEDKAEEKPVEAKAPVKKAPAKKSATKKAPAKKPAAKKTTKKAASKSTKSSK